MDRIEEEGERGGEGKGKRREREGRGRGRGGEKGDERWKRRVIHNGRAREGKGWYREILESKW